MKKQSIKSIRDINTFENQIAHDQLQKIKGGGLIGVFIIGALNP